MLFTVAFYDIVIVPLTTKFNRPISMTMRIGIGFFLEILALISAGIVETVSPTAPTPCPTAPTPCSSPRSQPLPTLYI